MDLIQLLNSTFGDGVSWKTTVSWRNSIMITTMVTIALVLVTLAVALALVRVLMVTIITMTMTIQCSSPMERAREKQRNFSKQNLAEDHLQNSQQS